MTSAPVRRFAVIAASAAGVVNLLKMWLAMGVVAGRKRAFAMGLVVYFGYFNLPTNQPGALCLRAFAIGPRAPGFRNLGHPITAKTAALSSRYWGWPISRSCGAPRNAMACNVLPMPSCIV